MTRRRVALYVSIACMAYVLALVATVPSAWVSVAIGRLSQQALQLREPQGSAWTGNGRLYLSRRSGELLDLGVLRWNASLPGSLLGRFVTDFSLGAGKEMTRMELSPASLVLHGVNLDIPGAVMTEMVPGLSALGPGGRLRVRSENLRVGENEFLGKAEIEWRPARLAAARGLDLGSHVVKLSGSGRRIDIELGTIEGPLRLSGGGAWTAEDGLTVSGTLEHGSDQPAFAPFLQGVCSEYAGGRCAFQIRR